MPWAAPSVMDQRIRFLALAKAAVAPFAQLCRRFGVSRTTGYKWLVRSQTDSLPKAAADRSRRPLISPRQTPRVLEDQIVALRQQYPMWGARKIGVIFHRQHPDLALPCERTLNRIFTRYHLVRPEDCHEPATKRFERNQPNELWQMDYKGEFAFAGDQKCFPLDVLDDHSRFNLLLAAHPKIDEMQVQSSLARTFESYGMPQQMLMDRGQAWYTAHSRWHWTQFSVWLMRLGIKVIYARARHPQTSGKIERFHRTLKYDLVKRQKFSSLPAIQAAFDRFRHEYNHVRPHEALQYQCPIDRYVPSRQPFPKRLPAPEYASSMKVFKLNAQGLLWYRDKYWFVSEALSNEHVGVEEIESITNVYFYKTLVKTIEPEGARGPA